MSSSRRHPAIAIFAASRVYLVIVAWIGLTFFPMKLEPGMWRAFPHTPLLDGWARFDSGWYWSLARSGYEYSANGQSNVVFFPLFPIVAGITSLPLRLVMERSEAFYLTGMVVSLAATFVGTVAFYRIGVARLGEPAARRALYLLLLFPFSFFFSACYSEGLFFGITAWAFYEAEHDRWWRASALASLAAVSRVVGFLVAVALAIEYVRRKGWNPRRWDSGAASFALTPIGLIGLLTHFWLRFGDPLVFRKSQAFWNRRTGIGHLRDALHFVLHGGAGMSSDLRLLLATYLVLLVAVVVLGVMAFRRLGPGYAVFALGSLALGASTGIDSLGRYVSVLFPVFLVAGTLTARRAILAVTLVVFGVLLTLFTYWFTNWHLVT